MFWLSFFRFSCCSFRVETEQDMRDEQCYCGSVASTGAEEDATQKRGVEGKGGKRTSKKQ